MNSNIFTRGTCALFLLLGTHLTALGADDCGFRGDIAPPGGNGLVNLSDILCVLQGFGNLASCPGADIHPLCQPNGIVNLNDILAILSAFGNATLSRCPGIDPPFRNPLPILGSLSAGDLDGDDDIDVVSTDRPDGNGGLISLLNDGIGQFSVSSMSVPGAVGNRVFTGDLDGDEILDAITTLDDAYVYKGLGDGTFGLPTELSLPGFEVRGTLGDWDEDLDLDLIVACWVSCTDARLYVYLNEGGELTLGPMFDIAPLHRARSILMTDIDGDLDNDLVLGGSRINVGPRLLIFLNQDGTYVLTAAYLNGITIDDIQSGFLNADAHVDLAVITDESSPHAVFILMGNGNGTFGSITNHYDLISYYMDAQIKAVDLDGDTDVDLLTSGLRLFRNDGVGNFTSSTSGLVPAKSFVVEDFDGDGVHDVFGASESQAQFYRNDGTGDFDERVPIPGRPLAIALADFDADGDLDATVGDIDSNTVSVLFNDGLGKLSQPVVYSDELGPFGVVAADLNGDLAPDLAMTNSDRAAVRVRFNLGGGSFGPAMEYETDSDAHGLAAGDLDGDLDIDLVVTNAGAGTISVLINTGAGVFATAVNYAVSADPVFIAVGDLDGDTDNDLAVAHGEPGGLTILLNDGSGTFTLADSYSVDGAQSLALLDLDDDTDLDIVTGSLTVLSNSGSATFTVSAYEEVSYPDSLMVAADFDADDDADMALPEQFAGTRVFLSICDGLLSRSLDAFPEVYSRGAAAGDMDGDDDIDLVVTTWSPNGVVVLRNSSPAFAP